MSCLMKFDIEKIKDAVIKFIYPSNPVCPICKRVLFTDKAHICFNCIDSVSPKNHNECAICSETVGNNTGVCNSCKNSIYDFANGYAYTDYDYISREVVLEFKFRFNKEIAKYCAKLMYEDIVKSNIKLEYDIITCVPSKKENFENRGYNQAAVIAGEFAFLSGIKVNNDLLVVVGTLKDQIGLSFNQRKENVKNKFALNPAVKENIVNKHILIVDDVVTTGATLSECAGVLKASGAESVSFITFASASRFYKEREV